MFRESRLVVYKHCSENLELSIEDDGCDKETQPNRGYPDYQGFGASSVRWGWDSFHAGGRPILILHAAPGKTITRAT